MQSYLHTLMIPLILVVTIPTGKAHGRDLIRDPTQDSHSLDSDGKIQPKRRLDWVNDVRKRIANAGSVSFIPDSNTIISIKLKPVENEEHAPSLYTAAVLAMLSEELHDLGFEEGRVSLQSEQSILKIERHTNPHTMILTCGLKEWHIKWDGPSSWNQHKELREAFKTIISH